MQKFSNEIVVSLNFVLIFDLAEKLPKKSDNEGTSTVVKQLAKIVTLFIRPLL